MAAIRGDMNIAAEEYDQQSLSNQLGDDWHITSQPYGYNPYQGNQYIPSTDYNQGMGYEDYSETATTRPDYLEPSYYSTEKPYNGYEQNGDNSYYPEQSYSDTGRPYEPTEIYEESYTPSYQSTTSRPVYSRPYNKVTTHRPYETTTRRNQQRPQVYHSSSTYSPRPHKVDQTIYSTTIKPSSSTLCPYHSTSYAKIPPQQSYEKPKVENKYPVVHQPPYNQHRRPKYGMVPSRVPSPRPAMMRPVYNRRPIPFQHVYRPRMQA